MKITLAGDYLIIICEPQSVGYEHSSFNAALITAVKYAFLNEKIVFIAEKAHLTAVKKILDKTDLKIEYKEIKVLPHHIIDPIRFPFELILFNKIFKIAHKLNSNKIIFSNIRRPGIVLNKILIRKYRDIKCFIVLHSILESIYKSPFQPTEIPFWFRFWISFANHRRLGYIILGPSIEKELLNELPNLKRYVLTIDLPYFYPKKVLETPLTSNVIKFGFFGFGSIRKGIDMFFQLAEDISNKKSKFKAEFILIGSLQNQKFGPITYKKIDKIENKSVCIPSPEKPLSFDDFEYYANSIDYAIILHKAKDYRLSAPASFFDSILYLKPIIAIKSSFIDYYFNKMGDIGYLCEDYQEIKELVLKILDEKPTEKYILQRANMLEEREKISLNVISQKLIKMWD